MTIKPDLDVQEMITKSRARKGKKIVGKLVPTALFFAATISVVSTFGIVFT